MDRYRLCNYHGLSSISLFFPLSSTHDSRYDRFSLFNQLLPSSRVLPDGQSGRKSRSYMVSDCFVSPDFDTWCFVFGHLYSFPLLLRRWILVRTISCDLPFVTLSWCLSRRDPSIGIQKKLSSHDFAGLVRLISWLHYRLHICVWGGEKGLNIADFVECQDFDSDHWCPLIFSAETGKKNLKSWSLCFSISLDPRGSGGAVWCSQNVHITVVTRRKV